LHWQISPYLNPDLKLKKYASSQGAYRADKIGAKIELNSSFCCFFRVIVGSIAQKSSEIGAVQMNLQPISLKTDRRLVTQTQNKTWGRAGYNKKTKSYPQLQRNILEA
jgi:hypothetical protein